MLVVSNKHLYSINEVEEDGFILTVNGEIPVTKGNLVLHNEFGDKIVETNEGLSDGYTSVKPLKKKARKTKMSPFELEFAKSLMEFGSLPSQLEDQDYIDKQREFTSNKAF